MDRIRKWISKNGIKWKSALNTEINYIQEIDEESLKEGTLRKGEGWGMKIPRDSRRTAKSISGFDIFNQSKNPSIYLSYNAKARYLSNKVLICIKSAKL